MPSSVVACLMAMRRDCLSYARKISVPLFLPSQSTKRTPADYCCASDGPRACSEKIAIEPNKYHRSRRLPGAICKYVCDGCGLPLRI